MNKKLVTIITFTCISTAWVNVDSDASTLSTLNQLSQEAKQASSDTLSTIENRTAIKLNNAQDVEQKVVVTQPKKDPTDCTQLHGNEFMECMACQSSDNLKKNLMNCNDRLAHYYFMHLYFIEEYHEALQNFTEKEWQGFYESRHPKLREHFPKTLEEQRAMLKKLYIHAYFYNSLEYWWSGQSAKRTDDLESFVRDFAIRASESSWFNPHTYCILQRRFSREKTKLFTKSNR